MSPSRKMPEKGGGVKEIGLTGRLGTGKTTRGSVSFGSEVAERPAPVYRDDQEALRLFGEVVDAIGANLDRSASALARIEAKLARA
jgi:hypothetical protein